MIHARPDYNRFQDPALHDPSLLGNFCSPIGEDEPVFLFRAKDENFLNVLEFYKDCLDLSTDEGDRMWCVIDTFQEVVRQWQKANGTKAPDLAEEID